MRQLLYGAGALVLGLGAYFTLRSKDKRVTDKNKVLDFASRAKKTVTDFTSNLTGTDKAEPGNQTNKASA